MKGMQIDTACVNLAAMVLQMKEPLPAACCTAPGTWQALRGLPFHLFTLDTCLGVDASIIRM